MLKIEGLSKSYGLHHLFEDVSFQMNPGERLGLVGRNGHGKSTLFKMILKEEEPDEGRISVPRNYRIGHLEQHLKFTKPTILEEACLGLQPDECDDFWRAETILSGLGFSDEDMERAPAEFSGGFQIRVNLAKVLVSKPNLLLLDEPTNYLDIVSLRWIVDFLRSWDDEMIIISHDRDFMDSVTTHSACIHRCKLKKIEGNTKKLYEQILQEEEIHEKTRVNDLKKRKDMEVFINRFKAKASKASVVQSRVKLLEKLPVLEKLSEIESLDFEFRHLPFPGKTIMEVENLTFGYDPDEPLIEDFSLRIGSEDRIAIIGKNGKGKSTLLNLMAGEITPNNGSVKTHPQTQLGYFGQTNIARLTPNYTIEDEINYSNPKLGRTAVRNICGTMMFSGEKAEKKISVLSGGEKSRVMLGKILATPSNLLFLDEPTNHLDMESIQAMIDSIENYAGAVVIVTHSEMILREVANRFVIFHNGGVEVFPGDYDDFLSKVGWEDTVKPKSKKKIKTEEQKTNEANHLAEAENAKFHKAQQKKIAVVEEEIVTLETLIEKQNQELVAASEKGDAEAIRKLSQSISAERKKIDELFELLAEMG